MPWDFPCGLSGTRQSWCCPAARALQQGYIGIHRTDRPDQSVDGFAVAVQLGVDAINLLQESVHHLACRELCYLPLQAAWAILPFAKLYWQEGLYVYRASLAEIIPTRRRRP